MRSSLILIFLFSFQWLIFSLLIRPRSHKTQNQQCPCSNVSLCNRITTSPSKEVYGFSESNSYWKYYNFSIITTIAVFDELDTDLLCYAHSQNVKIVLQTTEISVNQLTNLTARSNWVQENVQLVKDNFIDGLNIDFESAVANNSEAETGLTDLVKELRAAFTEQLPGAQLSFDVAWSSIGIDGRFFDVKSISEYTDFLFVMDYDTRSQIFPPAPCIASANSPLNSSQSGIQSYLSLGIPANKLILGVPWYGYDYPCTQLTSDNVCYIQSVPFRGCNCSDAAGTEIDYSVVLQLIQNNATNSPIYSNTLESLFFNYQSTTDGQPHQVWYDNPQSLNVKYNYAKEQNLLGVGFWELDALPYNDQAAIDMWNAINTFLN